MAHRLFIDPCARRRTRVAAAVLGLLAGTAQAQEGTLPPVTVTGTASTPTADVTGFGDYPLKEVPLSATVIDRRQIEASGARRLADLTTLDASVTDSYNAAGYWDFLTVRGFTLDNRFNYRREGLPISAETTLPLDNKERIEILKGTSGIQAGTSAPGGLVNYVVKRPTQEPLREVRLEATSRASLLAAADISQRFGPGDAFGLRINAAQERLRPQVRNIDGDRSLLSAAADWRISPDSVLEAEFEWSRRSQASQVGLSLLGNTLPALGNPRLNLNNQPWVQPSQFEAFTGTLRFEQALGANWRWIAQAGRQSLKTDDYTAFPYGCDAEGNYDRFCSDGTFDYYDFRSENERRRQDAVLLQLRGTLENAGIRHDLTVGVLRSRVRNRFEPQAFNYVGSGDITGAAIVPADPTRAIEGTNRDERSLEFSVQDAIRIRESLTAWIGLRHTRLDRQTNLTDGTEATDYNQSLTIPWLALAYKLSTTTLAYGSWGQGLESQVVPNRLPDGIQIGYVNAGQALPALKSRQVEFGFKGDDGPLGWQLAAFRIHRPATNLDACVRLYELSCTGRFDGEAVHRGLEAHAAWRQGPWRVNGGLTLIDAKRTGSTAEPGINGERTTNVPRAVARLQVAWLAPSVPGLQVQGQLSHEGRRNVLADGSISLPSWTTASAAVHYQMKSGAHATGWTLAIDNLFDRRYWRESPTQFGHVYLYPGAPRSVRLSFSAAL